MAKKLETPKFEVFEPKARRNETEISFLVSKSVSTLIKTVMGHFSFIPVQTRGRFGLIPVHQVVLAQCHIIF